MPGERPRPHVRPERGHRAGVGAHAGGGERVHLLQDGGGARRGEEFRHLRVPVQQRQLVRSPAPEHRMPADPVHLDPVREQQPDPPRPPAQRRRDQFLPQQQARRLQDRPQPGVPRPVRAPAQPELQQQPQARGVVGEGAAEAQVVEGLAVVGVGAGFQQQPGQGERFGVRRLVLLSAAERAGQCGEGGDQTVPEEAGIRVRAVAEEDAGRLHIPGNPGQTGVGQVQQRLPAERPALRPRQSRIPVQRRGQGVGRAGGGHGEDVRGGELRLPGQQLRRLTGTPGMVGPVREAGQPQELLRRLRSHRDAMR